MPGEGGRGVQHGTMVSILACGHNCLGSIPRIPEIFSEGKNVDVAEVNELHTA